MISKKTKRSTVCCKRTKYDKKLEIRADCGKKISSSNFEKFRHQVCVNFRICPSSFFFSFYHAYVYVFLILFEIIPGLTPLSTDRQQVC